MRLAALGADVEAVRLCDTCGERWARNEYCTECKELWEVNDDERVRCTGCDLWVHGGHFFAA